MNGSIAIFVKTPGHSPLKTRLAQSVGEKKAERFHLLAAAAVGEVVRAAASVSGLTPYWAVAERSALADPLWSSLETIHQGEGGLGDRLNHVYSTLRARHGSAILIGADSPQLTPDPLLDAFRLCLQGSGFVTGPAEDGGFYLFAGTVPIPRKAWLETPYSDSKTLTELERRISHLGKIHRLATSFDVDTGDELGRLRDALRGSPLILPAQAELLGWLEGTQE